MKKLNSLKNILLLVELFVNNALKGFLNRPIFKNKAIRHIMLISILIIYFMYFFYNMKELSKMTQDYSGIGDFVIETGQKITFFSYFSNSLVLGILLSVLINNTLALDKTSLFFAKTLPFKNKEVQFSYIIFKFIAISVIYELVMIIATPAIKIVTKNPIEFIFFFIVQHIFFLFVLLLIEVINLLLAFIFKNEEKIFIMIETTYNSLLLVASTLYFFNFRYPLEIWLSQKDVSVTQLIIITMFLTLTLVVVLVVFLLKIPASESLNYSYKFVKFPFLNKVVFRYRANWSLISCGIIIVSTILFQSGMKQTLSILPSILSFSGLLLMNYADSTNDFRKQYHLLRISVLSEWGNQVLLICLFAIPLIFFSFFNMIDLQQFVLSVSISIISLVLGYLFPKSEGSLNETNAMLLLMIIFVIINLLMKNNLYDLIILLLLFTIHYIVVRKVRYEGI